MNCPGCGVPLMGGMKVCPKCKWDTTKPNGGEVHLEYKKKLQSQLEEEQKKKQELDKLSRSSAEERAKRFSGSFYGLSDVVYHIEGARGRVIDIYPHKCVITTGVTFGSIITRNATDGEKTIYYQDCIGLQVKYPGLTIGYIQFETASMTMNNSGSNFFNENSFTFEESQITSDEMNIVVDYIKAQLEDIKNAQRNMWFKA